jgi:hypothetical protein
MDFTVRYEEYVDVNSWQFVSRKPILDSRGLFLVQSCVSAFGGIEGDCSMRRGVIECAHSVSSGK